MPIVGLHSARKGSIWPSDPPAVGGHRLWFAKRDQWTTAEDITDQRPFGDFTPGRYAWLLADVEALAEPVPARGRQGLWEWERNR